MPEMLVVGPEGSEMQRLIDLLHNAGYLVYHVDGREQALRHVKIDEPDAVFCFYHLPDGKATDLLRDLLMAQIRPPFVIICDFSESALAAEVVANGADDYLPMPFDPTEVAACAGRILSQSDPMLTECEQIRFEARDGILVMHFPPDMPFEISNNLNRLISAGLPVPERAVVLDLSNTTYFSSSGVSTLFLIYRHFQSLDGRIFVAGVKPQIRNVLRLAGVQGFFQFTDSLKEAFDIIDGMDDG